jgi:sulfonate transport system ATP-binding protein
MLRFDQLDKTYPNGTHALSRVTLDLAEGELVAIIGGSGCGKSTLLRLAAGLDRPTGGQVLLDEAPITAPHAAVGVVFQEPRLLPWLRIKDNIGFGIRHLPKDERDGRIARALERIGLDGYGDAWPRELSGGQAQRVAIARALVTRPKVMLLDEPFSALDAFTRASLQTALLDLWATAKPTLVIVTHDVEEAVMLADRIVVMQPEPGRLFAEVRVELTRPRRRLDDGFIAIERRVLHALDGSLSLARQRASSQANVAAGGW